MYNATVDYLQRLGNYRGLFAENTKMYKEASVTMLFLIETFIPIDNWHDFKNLYKL